MYRRAVQVPPSSQGVVTKRRALGGRSISHVWFVPQSRTSAVRSAGTRAPQGFVAPEMETEPSIRISSATPSTSASACSCTVCEHTTEEMPKWRMFANQELPDSLQFLGDSLCVYIESVLMVLVGLQGCLCEVAR
jgi:hypothetical protein